jgi:nitrate reductase gamma subunit
LFWKKTFTADFAGALPQAIALHMWICLGFLVYLPFTYMMHFVAKYFMYHKIRWDDQPTVPGSKMEKEIAKLLSQPVTWGAKHVNPDGKNKTWVDIATEETK